MRVVFWSVKELAEMTKDRVRNKFDSIIFVTGSTGKGKSTFLWKFFNKFDDFKVEEKLTYSRSEFIHLIRDFKFSYAWHDELISAGNKRKFYDQEQIELIEILTKYRSNYNIVGGAVPIFFTLDKELLKLVGMHINIVERGLAVVHLPREGRMYSDDPWDVKINSKLEEKWSKKKQKNPDFKIPYHKYTTFAGYVRFGKLTDNQEEYYEMLKETKRADSEERKENGEDEKEGFYDKTLRMLKEGKLDEDGLLQICLFNDKKLSSVKVRLNQLLNDEGEERTLTDFLKDKKKNTDTNKLHNNNLLKKLNNIGE